jgi:TRAP-type C4-dicarboxylate transport system permease small subunit
MNNLRLNILKFGKAINVINKSFFYISIGILAVAGTIISLDVFLRFAFKNPIPAATELTILLIPHIAIFPFAYTLVRGQHVRITLLTGRFHLKLRVMTEAMVYVVEVFFFSILFWYSWLAFWESFMIGEIMPAVIRLPWWAGKLAMPIGTLLIAAQCIFSFIEILTPKEEK